jgi:branched-chain amino acid transport system substrate-binding protein
MSTPTRRPRRRLHSVVAAVAVCALVAGCGGSAIEDQAVDGSAAVQTDTAVPGADVSAGTEGTSEAPDVGDAGGDSSASNQAPQAPSGGTKPGAQPAAQSGTKSAGGAESAGTTPVGTSVEKLIATSPIFGGKGACKPATLSEVNIGNVSTLSGVLGELFSPITPALNTFVTAQNACGGLNGHRIKFFQSDDQGDPSTASTKIQDMVQRNKVLAFVGNIQVLTIDAVAPVIKRLGVPIIGGNLSSNTWFTNPLIFPQGSNQFTISYAYLYAATKYHKVTKLGHFICIEVPAACNEINRGLKEMAPQFGATITKETQVSITAPSYVQQCLDFKNAGVEAVALSIDAASMKRLARSCIQVGYNPKTIAPPLSLGNEQQFLGSEWLGNTFVPSNVFPWAGNSTPVEKYYQAAIAKYNPGFATGGAAALGWSSGMLLIAASAGLSATAPSTQQLLDTLHTFKGQPWTTLGGASPAPLTFQKDGNPKVPYCMYALVSNDQGTAWKTVISKPICTDLQAPSDPQKNV